MRGRIRTIKPESLHDEELWDLEAELGAPVFRAFVGLWMYADREGRFEWRPRALKAAVLPYWEGDFSRVLDALTTRGFVVRYEVDGREYGLVESFGRHQVVNNREERSTIPPPPDSTAEPATSTREPRVNDACSTPLVHARVEGNGREGNGRERDARARDEAPLDEDEDQTGRVTAAVERRLRLGYDRRYRDALAASPPIAAGIEAARARVATWVLETAAHRGVAPEPLCDALLAGFFGNARAAQNGFKFSWLAQNPLEYLGAQSGAGGFVAPRSSAQAEWDSAVAAGDAAQKQHPGKDWDSPELAPYRDRLAKARDALAAEREQRERLS